VVTEQLQARVLREAGVQVSALMVVMDFTVCRHLLPATEQPQARGMQVGASPA
jgi:hypothetical protein